MARVTKEREQKIRAMSCDELTLFMVEKAHNHLAAKVAYDIAEVIDENNLHNPDPIVFDKRVSRNVMLDDSAEYHLALEVFDKICTSQL